jgi:hypothetical protein
MVFPRPKQSRLGLSAHPQDVKTWYWLVAQPFQAGHY